MRGEDDYLGAQRGHYTIGVMSTSEEQPQELVSVGTAAGQIEAEILKGLLVANDIDVWLNQESAGSAIGLGIGPMAEVEIMVRTAQAEEARQLLQDHSDAARKS